MIRMINIMLILAVIVLAIGLYNIKFRAETAEKYAQKIERAIAIEQEGIRVLRAEWSYLNQPERVQELAKRYTKLEALKASQIGSFSDLPMINREEDFYAPLSPKPFGGYADVATTDLGTDRGMSQ